MIDEKLNYSFTQHFRKAHLSVFMDAFVAVSECGHWDFHLYLWLEVKFITLTSYWHFQAGCQIQHVTTWNEQI